MIGLLVCLLFIVNFVWLFYWLIDLLGIAYFGLLVVVVYWLF